MKDSLVRDVAGSEQVNKLLASIANLHELISSAVHLREAAFASTCKERLSGYVPAVVAS